MAAVLQAQAVARHHHPRAEAHVVALDEADHHAALVGRGHVDGAALRAVAGAEVLRTLQVDQLGAAVKVGVVQHLRRGERHGARLAHVAVDVGKGQLHGLDLQVLRGHAVHRQAGQVEAVQDAQGDQCRDALPIGRNLMHRVAAVVLGDGRHPLGPVGREVGRSHGSAAGFGVRFGSGGHLAAVERFALGLGDQAQGAGGVGEGKAFAHVRRAAVRQEGLGEARLRGDLGQFGRGRPLVLHDHRHAIAALGDLDGRGQQIGEGQLAVAFMQGHPAGHGTRHGDGVPAALRGRLGVCAVLGAEVGGRPGRGRTARSVQALQ